MVVLKLHWEDGIYSDDLGNKDFKENLWTGKGTRDM
jgi:hypothetical protein